jgi:hypothetical protein
LDSAGDGRGGDREVGLAAGAVEVVVDGGQVLLGGGAVRTGFGGTAPSVGRTLSTCWTPPSLARS